MRHPLVLLVPSLPTLVLDEHRGHRTPMLEALAGAAEALAHDRPDVVLVLTARWETEGPFAVDVGARHRTLTDYTGLGVEVRYDCAGKPALGHGCPLALPTVPQAREGANRALRTAGRALSSERRVAVRRRRAAR